MFRQVRGQLVSERDLNLITGEGAFHDLELRLRRNLRLGTFATLITQSNSGPNNFSINTRLSSSK